MYNIELKVNSSVLKLKVNGDHLRRLRTLHGSNNVVIIL